MTLSLTPITPGTLTLTGTATGSIAIGPVFTVTDGSTNVVQPGTLKFSGATVTESPAGTALVTVSGGSQTLTLAKKTLTAANILAFDGSSGTNIQALAAPGAGLAIVVVQVAAILRPGATPFADGDDIYFGTYGSTGAIMEPVTHAAGMHGTDAYANLIFRQQSGAVLTEFENCPLVFNNFGAAYTAGNGTLDVAYSYYVATL